MGFHGGRSADRPKAFSHGWGPSGAGACFLRQVWMRHRLKAVGVSLLGRGAPAPCHAGSMASPSCQLPRLWPVGVTGLFCRCEALRVRVRGRQRFCLLGRPGPEPVRKLAPAGSTGPGRGLVGPKRGRRAGRGTVRGRKGGDGAGVGGRQTMTGREWNQETERE